MTILRRGANKIRWYWRSSNDWWVRLEGRDRIQIFLQAAIVCLTLGYVLVAHWQLKQMQNAGKQTDRLIGEAIKQSQAARDGATVANDSLKFIREVVERPYVVFEQLTPVDFAEGKVPTLLLDFKNQGRTPAYGVLINVTAVLSSRSLEKTIKFNPTTTERSPSIPASSGIRRYFTLNEKEIQLTKNLLDNLNSDKLHFFVYGFIEYGNASGTRYPRREYCLMYKQAPNRPSSLPLFEYCPDHNE